MCLQVAGLGERSLGTGSGSGSGFHIQVMMLGGKAGQVTSGLIAGQVAGEHTIIGGKSSEHSAFRFFQVIMIYSQLKCLTSRAHSKT